MYDYIIWLKSYFIHCLPKLFHFGDSAMVFFACFLKIDTQNIILFKSKCHQLVTGCAQSFYYREQQSGHLLTLTALVGLRWVCWLAGDESTTKVTLWLGGYTMIHFHTLKPINPHFNLSLVEKNINPSLNPVLCLKYPPGQQKCW